MVRISMAALLAAAAAAWIWFLSTFCIAASCDGQASLDWWAWPPVFAWVVASAAAVRGARSLAVGLWSGVVLWAVAATMLG